MDVTEKHDAVQWFPDKPHPLVQTSVLEAGLSRTLWPVFSDELDHGNGQVGVLKVKGGWQLVKPGDWIVTKGGVHEEVVKKADFEKKYGQA